MERERAQPRLERDIGDLILSPLKPSVTFSPGSSNGNHVTFVDCMTMPNVSDRIHNAFCVALEIFGAVCVLDAIKQLFNEQIPTPLMILTAISGATVALMSVGYYLKETYRSP